MPVDPGASDRRPRRLTDDVDSAYPDWSPDGGQIIFSRQVGKAFDLFTMDADGGNPKPLTQTPDRSEGHPAWSPDGKNIAFTAKPKDSPGGWERSVYVISAQGGEARQVSTSKFNALSPAWLVTPTQQP